MIHNIRLFRRHTERCNTKHRPRLGEDVLDNCDCNLGYKGNDSTTATFRRLMLIPAIKDQREAWRRIDDLERGIAAAASSAVTHAPEGLVQSRMEIRQGFDKYLNIVRTDRLVKETSIYSMFRPVGNAVNRAAETLGLKYVDELRPDFPTLVLQSWSHLSVNVRSEYRRYLEEFCQTARQHKWTSLDLTELLQKPARGKQRTPPPNPTEPFDLETEFPTLLAGIGTLDLGVSGSKRSYWKDNPATARAYLYLLCYTGLRKSDALLFEPRSLELRTEKDGAGNERTVYVRWVPKQKKTDAPVFVIIPKIIGDLIRQAPRLSPQYAFIPPGKSTGNTFRSWTTSLPKEVFRPLANATGVTHIHAHRFRDTFAVNLLDKGADIRFVSRALGHKSVAVTLTAYERYLKSDQRKAVQVMLECGY
jgi:integrase